MSHFEVTGSRLGGLGGHLGPFWQPREAFGGTLGVIWEALGSIWVALGSIWEVLGLIWEALGAIFEAVGMIFDVTEQEMRFSRKPRNS